MAVATFSILKPKTWEWEQSERSLKAGPIGDRAVTREERLQVIRDEPELSEKDYSYIERISRVPIYKFTDYTSFLDAGSKRIWVTFRCCHIAACATLTASFVIKGADDKPILKKNLRSLAPDLERQMRNPNPYDTWQELWYQKTFHEKLTGNCFWLKDQLDLKGRPLNIFSLLPQNMKVIPDAKDRVRHYEYFVNGKTLVLEPEEVIHFRRMHPMDNIMGLGDCEAGQELLSDFINRGTYNEKFYENGAMPSGVMMKDQEQVEESVWKRMVADFREKYQGKKNAGKVMMLQGKWTYQQLGLNAQQMQSIEKEKASIEQISMLHGTPLSLLGWSNAANYATARLDKVNYLTGEINPMLQNDLAKINAESGMVKSWNKDWEMDAVLPGMIDVEQVTKDYGPLVLAGAMTPNEYREKAGLDRDADNPNLDLYYVSNQVVPIDMAGMADPNSDVVTNITEANKPPPLPPGQPTQLDAQGKPIPPVKPPGGAKPPPLPKKP